ncbi:hypothetical protein JHK82_012412 [Glycine max]|nr:hypothetical protein JHK82_012412 [Glycine max]
MPQVARPNDGTSSVDSSSVNEAATVSRRVFSPSAVLGMQWKLGSPFQNQNDVEWSADNYPSKSNLSQRIYTSCDWLRESKKVPELVLRILVKPRVAAIPQLIQTRDFLHRLTNRLRMAWVQRQVSSHTRRRILTVLHQLWRRTDVESCHSKTAICVDEKQPKRKRLEA